MAERVRDRAAAASDGQSGGTVLEDEIDTNKLLMDEIENYPLVKGFHQGHINVSKNETE